MTETSALSSQDVAGAVGHVALSHTGSVNHFPHECSNETQCVIKGADMTQALKKSQKELLHRALGAANRNRQATTRKKVGIAQAGDDFFVQAYYADPMEVVTTVRGGVPAEQMKYITTRMRWPQEKSITALGLTRATFGRRLTNKEKLSTEESSRVFGLRRLIGQVEAMVRESGNPEGFDAPAWVGNWLERPQPSLGGKTPSSFMDTAEGQQLVMQVLAQAQSGAYA